MAFKLPRLSPAVSQVLTHVIVVFALAFGGQIAAAYTGAIPDMPTLLALVSSAAVAGLTAVIHYVAGIVPSPNPAVAATLATRSQVAQWAATYLAVFLAAFGAQLALGASHVVSIGTIPAVIVAACVAAVAAVAHRLAGLIPAIPPAPIVIPPAPAPAPAPAAKKAPAKKAAK